MEKESSDSSPEKSKSREDQEKVELSPEESDKTLERTEFSEKQCMKEEPSECSKSFSKQDFVIKETGTNLSAGPILDPDSEQVENLSSETVSIDVNEQKTPLEGDNLDPILFKTDQISLDTDVTSEQIETENVSEQSKSMQSCAENLNNPLLRRILSKETLSESVTICTRISSNEERKLIACGDGIDNEVKDLEENPRYRSSKSDEKTKERDLDNNFSMSTSETEESLSKQNSPTSDSKQSKPSSIVKTESSSQEHRAHSSQTDSSSSISPLALSQNIHIDTRLPNIDTSLENASLNIRALISPKKVKLPQLESQNSAFREGLGLRLDHMLGREIKAVFKKLKIQTNNLSPENTQTNQMSKITESSEHTKKSEGSHETSQLSETLSVRDASNTLQFDANSPVTDNTEISTLSQTPPTVDPSNTVQSGTNSPVKNSSETSQLAESSPILFDALTKQKTSDFKQSEALSSLQEQGESSQQKDLTPRKPNRKTRRPITESPDNSETVQSSSKLPDIPFESASRNVRALISPKKVRFSEIPWRVILFPRYRSELRNPRSRMHQPLQTKCTVAPKEKFEGLAGKRQAASEQPASEFLQPRDPPPSNLSPQKSILKTKRLYSDSLDNIKGSKSPENEASSPKKICSSDVDEAIKHLSLESETDLPSQSDSNIWRLSDEVENMSVEKCDECSVIPDTIQNSNLNDFPLQEMNHPSNIPFIHSPNVPNLQASSPEHLDEWMDEPMDALKKCATGVIANLFGMCSCNKPCNCSSNNSKIVNRSDSTSVYPESLSITSSISIPDMNIPHSVNEEEECAESDKLCSSGTDIEIVNRPNSDSAPESLPNTSDIAIPSMNRPQADTAHPDPVNLICPEQPNEQNSVTPREPENEN